MLINTSVLLSSLARTLDEPWVASVISLGELQAGVLLAGDGTVRAQRLSRLTALLAETEIVPLERAVAARYSELRAATGRQPANDLCIAAIALAHDFMPITADERIASLPLVRATLFS